MIRDAGNRWRARYLVLIGGLALAAPCLGGRGDVDPAYAGNGRLAASLVTLPDGRVLELRYDAARTQSSAILRDIRGNIDAGWGNAGTALLPAQFSVNFRNSAVYAADGGILIGGQIPGRAGNQNDMAVVKLSATGQIDTGFGDGGLLTRPQGDPVNPAEKGCWEMVQGLALSPDGSLLVLQVHYPECYEDPTRLVVRRFDATGRGEIPFSTVTGALLPAIGVSYVDASLLKVVADGRICVGGRICMQQDGSQSTLAPAPSLFVPAYSRVYPAGLLSEGDVLFASDMTDGNLMVQRSHADGSPVTNFGDGGLLTISASSLLPLIPLQSSISEVRAFEGKPGQSVYLMAHADTVGYFLCRLQMLANGAATPDLGFGTGGVVILGTEQSFPLGSTAAVIEQADGSVFVRSEFSVFRLLGTDDPSPGMLVLGANPDTRFGPANAGGSIRITVSRVAGSNGAIGVDYATVDDTAEAGTEYRATSGHLEWTDGDHGDRQILIDLLSSARSGVKSLKLQFSAPQGGTWTATDRVWIAVKGTAAAPAPAPAPTPSAPANAGAGGGGGGAWGPEGLLLLLLMLGRRALVLRLGHARQSRQIVVRAH